IQSRFWLQANLILFVWAGIGLWALTFVVPSRFARAVRVGLPLVALGGVVLPLALHYRVQDRSQTSEVRDFARAVLETMPRDALLISSGDYLTNSMRYLQDHESIRSDVHIVDLNMLQQPWEVNRVARYEPDVALPGKRLVSPPTGGAFDLRGFMEAN